MRSWWLLVFSIGIALVSACGGSGGGAGSQAPPASTTVTVTMSEFKLQVDTDTVPAGNVTFHLLNQGTEKHEVVILRTDLPVDSLPADKQEQGKVAEDAPGIQHVTELDGVDAGQQKDLNATLQPGRYLLVCNYPGHLHAGMVATLTVES